MSLTACMGGLVRLGLCLFVWLVLQSSVFAQGNNTDPARDPTLGAVGYFRPVGAAVALRYDLVPDRMVTQRFAPDVIGAIRLTRVPGDLVLGIYGSTNIVVRHRDRDREHPEQTSEPTAPAEGGGTSTNDSTQSRTFLASGVELTPFLLAPAPHIPGQLGLRTGVVLPTQRCGADNRAECVDDFITLIRAARPEPTDLAVVAPGAYAYRLGVHYRVDYGVLFAQLDFGWDRLWGVPGAATEHDGHIVRSAGGIGVGTTRWGLTYDTGQVWAQRCLFDPDSAAVDPTVPLPTCGARGSNEPSSEQARRWAKRTDRRWLRGASHTVALQFYRRHLSGQLGLSFFPTSYRAMVSLHGGMAWAF